MDRGMCEFAVAGGMGDGEEEEDGGGWLEGSSRKTGPASQNLEKRRGGRAKGLKPPGVCRLCLHGAGIAQVD